MQGMATSCNDLGAVRSSPTGLRLPEDLWLYLKHQAVENRRSLNSELVVRLEQSRRQEASGQESRS
jgi:hypothetical protein